MLPFSGCVPPGDHLRRRSLAHDPRQLHPARDPANSAPLVYAARFIRVLVTRLEMEARRLDIRAARLPRVFCNASEASAGVFLLPQAPVHAQMFLALVPAAHTRTSKVGRFP